MSLGCMRLSLPADCGAWPLHWLYKFAVCNMSCAYNKIYNHAVQCAVFPDWQPSLNRASPLLSQQAMFKVLD